MNFTDLKELSKFELATVKRTAASTKRMRTKVEKLTASVTEKQAEIEQLTTQIELFENPIREITGGFTSEEVLDGTRDAYMRGEITRVALFNTQEELDDETSLEETIVSPEEVDNMPNEALDPTIAPCEPTNGWNMPQEKAVETTENTEN